MSAIAAAAPSPFAVFRNRSFRLLWIGQFVSSAGTALSAMASGILVYRITGTAASVGLIMIATALPTLFVGLIAGVFVDRFDRRKIMIVSDGIRGLFVLLIPVLIPANIAWLYILTALASAVQQFFDPAYSSILPEVASDDELAAANSMMTISTIGAQAIGFLGSGVIATAFPIEWCFILDALSFVFSSGCIYLVKLAPYTPTEDTSVGSVVRNLKAGGRQIWDTPILRSMFLVYLPVLITFGLNNALTLPFAFRALDATEFEYTLIEAISTIGFVAGGLIMARVTDRLREGQWVAISFIGMALCSLLYSQLTRVPPAIVLGIVAAGLNAPSVVGRQLIIQRNTPREMRGRVYSAFFVMRDTMFMAGMAMAGLADVFDIRAVFFMQSLAFFFIGLLALVLPGLGQPAAEWRRAISLLRGAKAAPGLGPARAATVADYDRLAGFRSELATLSAKERQSLAAHTLVAGAPAGGTILRKGESSDAAYFVLDGRAVAGWDEEGGYRPLETLNPGDFFGEIAAISGTPRTANVVAEQPTVVVQIPAPVLREMMGHPELGRLFTATMNERMVRMKSLDRPRATGLDQDALRELRADAEPA